MLENAVVLVGNLTADPELRFTRQASLPVASFTVAVTERRAALAGRRAGRRRRSPAVLMRALTIRQPWAWAVICGGKDVENRAANFPAGYRGWVAVHAGLKDDLSGLSHPAVVAALRKVGVIDSRESACFSAAPRGAVVGAARVVGAHLITGELADGRQCSQSVPEVVGAYRARCSPWADPFSVWHVELADAVALPVPVPCRGQLGLWTLPPDVEAQVREQVKL